MLLRLRFSGLGLRLRRKGTNGAELAEFFVAAANVSVKGARTRDRCCHETSAIRDTDTDTDTVGTSMNDDAGRNCGRDREGFETAALLYSRTHTCCQWPATLPCCLAHLLPISKAKPTINYKSAQTGNKLPKIACTCTMYMYCMSVARHCPRGGGGA